MHVERNKYTTTHYNATKYYTALLLKWKKDTNTQKYTVFLSIQMQGNLNSENWNVY